MRYVKPDYFDDFCCAADKCPDTCCAGWQIVIDEAALEKYAGDRGKFGKRLHRGIDWQEGCFVQLQGRCSMLNERNLCDLVTEKGEEWLCSTCDRYPRHEEEFDGLREWSLSLSCPIAAEGMLCREKPVTFIVEEDDSEEPLAEEFEDFDWLLFTKLEDARSVMLAIAQNRGLSLECRMSRILELARKMQEYLDEGRLGEIDELFAGQEEAAGSEDACGRDELFAGQEKRAVVQSYDKRGEEQYGLLQKGFSYLQSLERLREDWTLVLEETQKVLYNDYEQYREIYDSFQSELYNNREKHDKWEIYGEQLLVFFLFTYFCGAVYDDWIYSKAALAVFSVTFIREFVMCRWFLADKHIGMQDGIELAYRYAREVEHSDDNLNLLEEYLNKGL